LSVIKGYEAENAAKVEKKKKETKTKSNEIFMLKSANESALY